MKNEEMSKFNITVEAKIPDSDAMGWINTLTEAGFSEKEIDLMMSQLNKTYRAQKGEAFIEDELKKIEAVVHRSGKSLTKEQKEYFRKTIMDRG